MPKELHKQAKQPVSALAAPYGHPFDAVVVTAPVGAWAGSALGTGE
ncbi:hypothetical protein GLX30_33110 [Streptomyces sp. Tu 2975]|nr:hypothetical protein [Streptomyces sp. Tu 2975]QIP82731.1 hypothetical protein GLX30_33110 [Streptomyces sp. Tu 2975]